jgi:hypothetical protein
MRFCCTSKEQIGRLQCSIRSVNVKPNATTIVQGNVVQNSFFLVVKCLLQGLMQFKKAMKQKEPTECGESATGAANKV